MPSDNPRSTARVAGHPLHVLLVPIPIVCFVATLLTDIVYAITANIMWADMSAWMLTIGLIVAAFAVLAGIIDFFGDRRIRAIKAAWLHGLGNGMALALAIVNAFVHSRDAYTSVVPWGLTLSAVVVAILVVTAWLGSSLVYRHGVGVRPEYRP
jgi:uncharacterized membrane protein